MLIQQGEMKPDEIKKVPFGAPFLFLWLLFFAGGAQADCSPGGPFERVQVERVIDGDTLRLTRGESVRLIGVNAPEINHRTKNASEPLALAAKDALARLIRQGGSAVQLLPGRESHDRYGRVLAYVRTDQGLLNEALLRQGMGFVALLAPNDGLADCLLAAEASARQARRGVWGQAFFAVRKPTQLKGHTGFQRVAGQVSRVRSTRNYQVLEMGPLALLVPKEQSAQFAAAVPGWPQKLKGQQLLVRGWVSERRLTEQQRKRGFTPFSMKVSSPAMLDLKDGVLRNRLQ